MILVLVMIVGEELPTAERVHALEDIAERIVQMHVSQELMG